MIVGRECDLRLSARTKHVPLQLSRSQAFACCPVAAGNQKIKNKTISSEEDVRSAGGGGGGEEEIRDAMMLKKMPKAISSHATITTSCYVGATGNDSRNIDRQRLPCCKIITMQDHYCGNVARLFYGVVTPISTIT